MTEPAYTLIYARQGRKIHPIRIVQGSSYGARHKTIRLLQAQECEVRQLQNKFLKLLSSEKLYRIQNTRHPLTVTQWRRVATLATEVCQGSPLPFWVLQRTNTMRYQKEIEFDYTRI